jgi:hypothetical protein
MRKIRFEIGEMEAFTDSEDSNCFFAMTPENFQKYRKLKRENNYQVSEIPRVFTLKVFPVKFSGEEKQKAHVYVANTDIEIDFPAYRLESVPVIICP